MMKYFFYNLFKKRVEILISALFFTILFNNKTTNIVLSILVLIVFLDKNNYQFKLNKKVIISFLLFSYFMIRELFCFERKGIDYIIRLIPILILLISLGLYKFKHPQIKFIANSLILINYIFFVFAILLGIYNYTTNISNNIVLDFSYYQWSVPIKMDFHPPYWGLFIVLSFVFVLRNKVLRSKTKIYFGFFSFCFLFFLSSRTALLIIICIVVFELISNKLIRNKVKYFIIVSFFSGIVILSFFSPYLIKKNQDNSGIQERIKLWDATIDAFEVNYLFGNSVSKGDEMIKYFYNLKYSNIENYDPHNQFLFFAVNYGYLGVFLFFFLLLYNENYSSSMLMFIFVIMISFVTESILNRQMGVFIFALFFSIFANKSYSIKML